MSPTFASSRPELWTCSTAAWSTRRKASVWAGSCSTPFGSRSIPSSRKRARSLRRRSRSTPTARRISSPEASWATAYSRCSSVRCACRRVSASRYATFRIISTAGLNIGRLLLLHAGPERIAALPRSIVDQGHLGLRHLVRVDAADAVAAGMDVHHDPVRLGRRPVEDRLQDLHHERHGRVVVVVEEDPVERGLLGLRAS